MMNDQLELLLAEADKFMKKYELSKTVGPDYYEPGMMEHLDKYWGQYFPDRREFLLRFEVKGTRYAGRTEKIEKVQINDHLRVVRDRENAYNHNNFLLTTEKGQDVGTLPAELCNAIAPLFDSGQISFKEARVSYAQPISQRSRYAKQAILFVELNLQLLT